MATLTRTTAARKRQLGIETLESRLNLSTLTTLAVPASQSTGLATSSITNTTASSPKLISVSDGAIAGSDLDPFKNLRFGDTAIASSGTTNVDVTGYSAISNASVNWSSPANVGNMATSGVNLQYNLNTTASGTYRLEFDVAATRWASFDLYVNGTRQAQYSFLPTGSMSNYTGTVQNVTLAAGANTISITPTWESQFNINAIKVTAVSVDTSSSSSNNSSNNSSSTTGTGTITMRADQNSAISNAIVENQSTTPNIGGMGTNGAYVDYTVNVATAGTYNLSANVAANSWAAMGVSVNGGAVKEIDINATGGWNSYKAATGSVYLPAGTVKIRFSNLYGTQYNLGTFTLAGSSSTTTDTSSSNSSSSTTTTGSSLTLTADKYTAISGAKLETQGGTQDIGGMSTSGAYVEYTLNVATAGTYNLSANVAANSWAAMGVSINGGAVKEVDINATGGWSSFKAATASVYLPAGTVKLRFSNLYGTQYNLGTITLAGGSVSNSNSNSDSSSSSNTNTNTNTNTGTTNTLGSSLTLTADKYSAISGAKLESQGGTQDIGGMSTSGAYVEYTLNVTTAGTYNLSANVAANAWAAMGISINGGAVQEVDINSTGGWSAFKASATSVYLPAGTVKIRFSNLYGTQYNLGTMTFGTGTTTPTTPPPTTPPVTTPQSPDSWSSGTVTVATAWMTSFNQLNITGSSGNDSIYVSQSGNTITVSANGKSQSFTGNYGNIMVQGGDDNDTITIDSSVRVDAMIYGGGGNNVLKNFTQGKATIVSIGGGWDTLQGNGINTSYWADSSDQVNASTSEWNNGRVHQVSSFWNGVSTQLNGQNLTDPSGTGSTTRLTSSSFWGTGPQITDVVQGLVPDCYVVGTLQTLAFSSPDKLREMAVDLGDGTYAIRFVKGGVTQYVRVDGDLPAGGPYAGGLQYAHPGPSGNQWAPIFEKAYAEIGTGGWSYSSLNYGWFGNVFSALGVNATTFGTGDANSFYNSVSSALAAGKGVTIGTNPSVWGVPLIGDHTYTVVKAWRDQYGTAYITVRNPWGYDGAGSDSNPNDGYITVAVSQITPFLMAGTIS